MEAVEVVAVGAAVVVAVAVITIGVIVMILLHLSCRQLDKTEKQMSKLSPVTRTQTTSPQPESQTKNPWAPPLRRYLWSLKFNLT